MEENKYPVNLPPTVRVVKKRTPSSLQRIIVGERRQGWIGYYNNQYTWGFIRSGTERWHDDFFFTVESFQPSEESKSFCLNTQVTFTVGSRIWTHKKNFQAQDIEILESQEQ